jgi:DNA-binding NtrC family response regulator
MPGKKRPTVLLIDDSTELLDFTADHLRDRGFDVVGAGGGAEALALLEKEPDRFDVIVTDFAMPLVSGLEVIRFARSLQPGWPAIVISGYADGESMAARPPDVPLINKPFQPEELIGAIGKIYNQAK